MGIWSSEECSQVRLDNENQWFYIQGVIRPEDISSSNVVLSTSIADAMIELSGRGPVSDKQSPRVASPDPRLGMAVLKDREAQAAERFHRVTPCGATKESRLREFISRNRSKA